MRLDAVETVEMIYEQILVWTKTNQLLYGEAALIDLAQGHDDLKSLLALLDALIAKLDRIPDLSGWSACLRYVKGRAMLMAGRKEDALKAFELVVSEYLGQEEMLVQHSVAHSIYGKAKALNELGDKSARDAAMEMLAEQFGQSPDLVIQNDIIRPMISDAHGHIVINMPAQHALRDPHVLNQAAVPQIDEVPHLLGAGPTIRRLANWMLRRRFQARVKQHNREWAARFAEVATSSHNDAMKVLEQNRQHGAPYGLYLRGFDVESQSGSFERADGMYPARMHKANPFETTLATQCKASVPIIGISNPYATTLRKGECPKIEVLHETWRAIVLELIERASFIVFQLTDASEGISYELNALLAFGRQDSAILVKSEDDTPEFMRHMFNLPEIKTDIMELLGETLSSFPYRFNQNDLFPKDSEPPTGPNFAPFLFKELLERAAFVNSLDPEVRRDASRVEELYRKQLSSLARISSEPSGFYDRATLFRYAGETIMRHDHGMHALRSFLTAIAILQGLNASDLKNVKWLTDLSMLHEVVGGLLKDMGDLNEALDHFRAAIDVSQRMVAEGAEIPGRHGVLVSYGRIGDILVERRDIQGALVQWQAARQLAAELAAEEPDKPEWRQYLSGAHNRLGGLQFALGEVALSIENYRASQTILEQLVAFDPSNAAWEKDLAFTYKKLGLIFSETKEPEEALQAFQRSRRLFDRLAPSAQNENWREEIEFLDQRIAALSLSN